jgi:hypothetical protein
MTLSISTYNYTERRVLFIVKLDVIIPIVTMMNVIMLNVVVQDNKMILNNIIIK